MKSIPANHSQDIKSVQGIIGCLLYYAQAIDNKLLSSATQNTLIAIEQLLNYVATHPDDGTTYKASNSTLRCQYLSESKSHSQAGAHIFLVPQSNGPVRSITAILQSVYASAAEAELAAIYKCAHEMVPLPPP